MADRRIGCWINQTPYLGYRLLIWTTLGLVGGLSYVRLDPVYELADLTTQMLYSLRCIVLFGLIGELVVKLLGRQLQPAERLSWSLTLARASIAPRLLVGVILGLCLGVAMWFPKLGAELSVLQVLLFALVFGLVFGLMWGISLGVASGLSAAPIPTHSTPNEGIRRSVRHGSVVGLLGSLIVGILLGSTAGVVAGPQWGLVWGLSLGLGSGVLWGLASGLGAAVQYLAFRVLLWRYNLAPWRYIRWLTKANVSRWTVQAVM